MGVYSIGQSRTDGTVSWVLSELVARLSRLGYGEYYASFSPLAPRLESWQAHCQDVPSELNALVDLFLLANPVALDELPGTLQDLIECLCQLGLLIRAIDGRFMTPNLVLVPILGNWLFLQKPSLNPTVYFGDDSMALLARLRPKWRGRCLDLCAGAGIQALHCSLFAEKVAAVERNPVAAYLAYLNVLMNGRQSIVTVYCGDLYEPIDGEIYDTIVANPPLIPFPEDAPYPFVGHGGADGLRVTWRILRGLSAALAADGTAQLIGACLSDGKLPLVAKALENWACEARMDMLTTITAHQPLAPGSVYFDALVYTAAAGMNSNLQMISEMYQRLLTEQGASHLCTYFLHVTRGVGKMRIQDLSRDGAGGLWYV